MEAHYVECEEFTRSISGCGRGSTCDRRHHEPMRFLFQSGLIKGLRQCPHTREHCPFTSCPFFHGNQRQVTSGEAAFAPAQLVSHTVALWDTENVSVPAGTTAAAMLTALQYAVQAIAGISGPLVTSAFYGSYRRHLPEPIKTSMRLAGATLVDAGRKQGGVDVAMKGALNDTIVAALLQRLEGTSAESSGSGAAGETGTAGASRGTEPLAAPLAAASALPTSSAPAAAGKRRPVLVLASGDRDFGDDLRRLRRTGFETVAVHGAESCPDFVALADHALRWEAVAALALLLAAERVSGAGVAGVGGSAGTSGLRRGRGIGTVSAAAADAPDAAAAEADIVTVAGTGECAVLVSANSGSIAVARGGSRGSRGQGRGRGRGRSLDASRDPRSSRGASPQQIDGTDGGLVAAAVVGAAGYGDPAAAATSQTPAGQGTVTASDNRSRSTSKARARRAAASAAAAASLAARTVAFALPGEPAASSGAGKRNAPEGRNHDCLDADLHDPAPLAVTGISRLMTRIGGLSSRDDSHTMPSRLPSATVLGCGPHGPPYPSLTAAAAGSAMHFPVITDALITGSGSGDLRPPAATGTASMLSLSFAGGTRPSGTSSGSSMLWQLPPVRLRLSVAETRLAEAGVSHHGGQQRR